VFSILSQPIGFSLLRGLRSLPLYNNQVGNFFGS
jgi:hypothetical protein